jgi:hypothetical protein
MDLEKVLAQLRGELENVDGAIRSLERLQQATHRRGRPPLWLAENKDKKKKTARSRRGRKAKGAAGDDVAQE